MFQTSKTFLGVFCVAAIWFHRRTEVVHGPLFLLKRFNWSWLLRISPAVTCPHHILSCCCASLRRSWFCLLPALPLGSHSLLLSKLLKPTSVPAHRVLQSHYHSGGPRCFHSTVAGVSLVWGTQNLVLQVPSRAH